MFDGKNAVRCPGAFTTPINLQCRGGHMYLLRKPVNNFRRDFIIVAPTLTGMAKQGDVDSKPQPVFWPSPRADQIKIVRG